MGFGLSSSSQGSRPPTSIIRVPLTIPLPLLPSYRGLCRALLGSGALLGGGAHDSNLSWHGALYCPFNGLLNGDFLRLSSSVTGTAEQAQGQEDNKTNRRLSHSTPFCQDLAAFFGYRTLRYIMVYLLVPQNTLWSISLRPKTYDCSTVCAIVLFVAQIT
jgi:hypothetical protein